MHQPRREGPGHPAVYIPESQALENQFSFWPRYDELTDITDIAKEYVAAKDSDPMLRTPISQALDAVDKAGANKVADARRVLVTELKRAMPDLPLDESFVEESAISRFQGHNALYITDRQEERAPSTIKGGFEKVEMVALYDIHRRGLPLRQIRIFACYNYHTSSL